MRECRRLQTGGGVSRAAAALPFPPAPPDRGRLLTPDQVAELVGSVSPAWVRRTVPGKIVLGQRTVRWYEDDVRRWIASRQLVAPGGFARGALSSPGQPT